MHEMTAFYPHIYTFILPLFIGNVLHMLIVKRNYMAWAARPLSVPLFGAGKTYRAFIVMPVACGLSCLFFRALVLHEPGNAWSFSIGFILGLTYLIAELPNSYIKRRLGISSGQSHHRYKLLQHVIDKTDSLLPVTIVYYFITSISGSMAVELFVVSFIIHVTFSLLLFQLKIKKSF